jgi:hypothetical protein
MLMVLCQRCGKGEAEWQCKVCGRVVDTACARPTPDGVFCIDHVPMPGKEIKQTEKKQGGGSNALKQLFVTLLSLTLGLALIIYVGDYMITRVLGEIGSNMGISESLKSTGWTIVYGMGGLTLLIGLGWLLTTRRPK